MPASHKACWAVQHQAPPAAPGRPAHLRVNGMALLQADSLLMRLQLTMVPDSFLYIIRDGLGAHSCHQLHQVLLLQFRGSL